MFASGPLKQTKRLMVKDENICVHCGLCAERCPTLRLGHAEVRRCRGPTPEPPWRDPAPAATLAEDRMNRVNDFAFRSRPPTARAPHRLTASSCRPSSRMGMPVTGKNVFPSNIQGLPTWYDPGEQGRLHRPHSALRLDARAQPATSRKDVAEVRPGGWLLYDSTCRSMSRSSADINYIGIPLAADVRQCDLQGRCASAS